MRTRLRTDARVTPDSCSPRTRRTHIALRRLRADLHCHSRASSGPAAAVLGMIGCPESYSEPERVYDQALARGMDLVALTDHDTIAGAMELVERGFEGVIVGEEVTVYFPEDRCKLHVLVWGLTPEQHEAIGVLGLREDVYEFAAWLREHNLAHSLAHPLYIQNARLTPWHVERCVLLFKCFETLNGAHSGQHRGALEQFLQSLTPGKVLTLVDRHNLHPVWPRIWEKGRTGGSDDHGLLNVGCTWTEVELDDAAVLQCATAADTARAFLKQVMACRSSVGGVAGHSMLLAHQLAAVGAEYVARRAVAGLRPRQRLVASRFLRFAGVEVPEPGRMSLIADTIATKVRGAVRGKSASPLMGALQKAMPEILGKFPELRCRLDPVAWPLGSALSEHTAMADFVEELSTVAARAISRSALESVKGRDRAAMAEHLAGYACLLAAQAPYIFSLFHQNKERRLLDAFQSNGGERAERPLRVCLFTDTLGDVNGVSRFIRDVAEEAQRTGRNLRVLTSTRFEIPVRENLINFDPVLAMRMPKYEHLELALPPLVRMLRYVDEVRPDVIHVSTPGSVGGVGLIAAKMLRVPVVGVYHTDFPAYIDRLFDDHGFTALTSKFMRFFYAGFKTVFTRSADYAESLVNLGITRDRIVRLKPGINVEKFSTAHRDEGVWGRVGVPSQGVKVIYCGRVSVEKNLPLLCQVWQRVRTRLNAGEAQLVIIGDGPYKQRMEEELGESVHFLGFRHGQELSSLYASADMFVFPSTTDTLGQVVMEAQASGLPVLVTDKGGPREVVREGETGLVLSSESVEQWAEAIVSLVRDHDRRRRMGAAAAEYVRPMSIRASFEHWWEVHEQALRQEVSGGEIRAQRPKAVMV